MAPAVCRSRLPRPNANIPQIVRYNAPPMTARSTFGWAERDVRRCLEDRIAWPRKNAMKARHKRDHQGDEGEHHALGR